MFSLWCARIYGSSEKALRKPLKDPFRWCCPVHSRGCSHTPLRVSRRRFFSEGLFGSSPAVINVHKLYKYFPIHPYGDLIMLNTLLRWFTVTASGNSSRSGLFSQVFARFSLPVFTPLPTPPRLLGTPLFSEVTIENNRTAHWRARVAWLSLTK